MRRELIAAAVGLPTALTLALGTAAAASLHVTQDLVGATFEIEVPACGEDPAAGQARISWAPERACPTDDVDPGLGEATPESGEATPESGEASPPATGEDGGGQPDPADPSDDSANAEGDLVPQPSDPSEIPGSTGDSVTGDSAGTDEPTEDDAASDAPATTDSREPA